MLILEEHTGLNAGLNRGFKIGKMLKKNVRLRNVSVKNAIKVGKTALPLATTAMTFIPGGGIAGKLLNSKAGKVLTKFKNGKVGKFATRLAHSQVGKFAMKHVVKPSLQNRMADNDIATTEPAPMPNATPTPAQMETIAEVKGVSAESLTTGTGDGEAVPNEAQLETLSGVKNIPVQDLKEEAASQKENAKTENTPTKDKPNYTLPLVIGAVAVGGILLAKNKSNN